jgi:hypothetical protein
MSSEIQEESIPIKIPKEFQKNAFQCRDVTNAWKKFQSFPLKNFYKQSFPREIKTRTHPKSQ